MPPSQHPTQCDVCVTAVDREGATAPPTAAASLQINAQRLHAALASVLQIIRTAAGWPRYCAARRRLARTALRALSEPFTPDELDAILALLRTGHPFAATAAGDALYVCIEVPRARGDPVLSASRRQQVLDSPDLLAALVSLALDTSSGPSAPHAALDASSSPRESHAALDATRCTSAPQAACNTINSPSAPKQALNTSPSESQAALGTSSSRSESQVADMLLIADGIKHTAPKAAQLALNALTIMEHDDNDDASQRAARRLLRAPGGERLPVAYARAAAAAAAECDMEHVGVVLVCIHKLLNALEPDMEEERAQQPAADTPTAATPSVAAAPAPAPATAATVSVTVATAAATAATAASATATIATEAEVALVPGFLEVLIWGLGDKDSCFFAAGILRCVGNAMFQEGASASAASDEEFRPFLVRKPVGTPGLLTAALAVIRGEGGSSDYSSGSNSISSSSHRQGSGGDSNTSSDSDGSNRSSGSSLGSNGSSSDGRRHRQGTARSSLAADDCYQNVDNDDNGRLGIDYSVEQCAIFIHAIRRWPVGRAAVLAHPGAAEALVGALGRLSRAAPSRDLVCLLVALVYTLEDVYNWLINGGASVKGDSARAESARIDDQSAPARSSAHPARSSDDSAHNNADSAAQWRQPTLVRQLADVLAPLAIATSRLGMGAGLVLAYLTKLGPEAAAALLTSPALRAALPTLLLHTSGSCTGSARAMEGSCTGSSGATEGRFAGSSGAIEGSCTGSVRAMEVQESAVDGEGSCTGSAGGTEGSRADMEHMDAVELALMQQQDPHHLKLAGTLLSAAHSLPRMPEMEAARGILSLRPIVRAATRAFVREAEALLVACGGDCSTGSGSGRDGTIGSSSGCDNSSEGSSKTSSGNNGSGSNSSNRSRNRINALLTAFANPRVNEDGDLVLSVWPGACTMLEDERAVSDAVARLITLFAAALDGTAQRAMHLILKPWWARVRLLGLLSLLPHALALPPDVEEGERRLARSFCAGCGAPKGRVKLRVCASCRQAAFCGATCQKDTWRAHKAACKAAAASGRKQQAG